MRRENQRQWAQSDIWLPSVNAEGSAAAVQCKHWMVEPVGVKELREFYGVMPSHKLARRAHYGIVRLQVHKGGNLWAILWTFAKNG